MCILNYARRWHCFDFCALLVAVYINNVCNGTIWYTAHGIDLFYWFVLVACKLIISWQLASCLAQCMQWCSPILGQGLQQLAGWLWNWGEYYLNILLLQAAAGVCLPWCNCCLLIQSQKSSIIMGTTSDPARDRENHFAGIILQQTCMHLSSFITIYNFWAGNWYIVIWVIMSFN